MLVACGFDSLSPDEETALQGITDRLYGKGNERAERLAMDSVRTLQAQGRIPYLHPQSEAVRP